MVRSAFSLIELLVVISIIAVLGALLLTMIPRVRDSAHATVCAGHVRQLALGVIAVAQESRGVLPWSDPFPGAQVWPGCIAGDTMFRLRDDSDVPLQAWSCPTAAYGRWAGTPWIVDTWNNEHTEATAQLLPYRGRVVQSYQYFGPYVYGPFPWDVRSIRTAKPDQVLISDFTMNVGADWYTAHRTGGKRSSNHAFVDGSVGRFSIDEQDQYYTNGPFQFYSRLMRP